MGDGIASKSRFGNEETEFWASKMSPQIKALAPIAKDLSFIPGTHR